MKAHSGEGSSRHGNGWLERLVRTALLTGAELHETHRCERRHERFDDERLRFETMVRMVSAQTFEIGALDATLGVGLAVLSGLAIPMFEHAEGYIALVSAWFMVGPILAVSVGLFRIRTESPVVSLVTALRANESSMRKATLELATGYEANREKLLGKRALLGFAVLLTAVLVATWAIPVVQSYCNAFHKPALAYHPMGDRLQAGRHQAANARP